MEPLSPRSTSGWRRQSETSCATPHRMLTLSARKAVARCRVTAGSSTRLTDGEFFAPVPRVGNPHRLHAGLTPRAGNRQRSRTRPQMVGEARRRGLLQRTPDQVVGRDVAVRGDSRLRAAARLLGKPAAIGDRNGEPVPGVVGLGKLLGPCPGRGGQRGRRAGDGHGLVLLRHQVAVLLRRTPRPQTRWIEVVVRGEPEPTT